MVKSPPRSGDHDHFFYNGKHIIFYTPNTLAPPSGLNEKKIILSRFYKNAFV